VRFPDKNDGNENYNVWRMVKKDGHLVSIQKTKVPFTQEETPTAVQSVRYDEAQPHQQVYDLQGRLLNSRSSKGVVIINGKKFINQ
jgi:YD repeat-containing protein